MGGSVNTGGEQTAGGETGTAGDGAVNGEGGAPDVGPEPVLSLVSGSRHQCLLYGAGRVKCWGDNEFGQLGLGDIENRGDDDDEMGSHLPDVDLGTGRYAKSLAAGWYATCAILDDDTLKCWGSAAIVGNGSNENVGDDPGEMGDDLAPVELGTGRKPVRVAMGAEHNCVLLDDGSAKCFGWNAWGQAGVLPNDEAIGREPNEMGDNLPPLDAGVDVKVLQTAPGAMHTCAILTGGSVKCWGYGPGLGNYTAGSNKQAIVDVPATSLGSGRTAKFISAGYSHSCAILDDDSLKCWGVPAAGETGIEPGTHGYQSFFDDMGDSLPAVDLGSGRHAIDVQSGGDQHTCALLDDHHLKCWGLNTLARLGSGDDKSRGSSAADMGDNLPSLRFGKTDEVKSFSSCVHSCALLKNGEVKCWGWNYYGQLGLGDTETRGDDPNEMGKDLPAVHWW
jgi:alpha-tubulin suppressor-like RCC1 family protein